MEVLRKDRDTPKSRRTRARILDEAVKVIASSGYAAATNAAVAEAAGITRGAMLYHFPTREDLLEGVIGYLQAERAELFRRAAEDLPPGADVTEHAIDSYWDLLRHPAFTAFMELEMAARTDFMIFSEPTWGLDVASSEFIHEKILEIRSRGVGVLLISSNLDEILALADTVAVMYRGRIVGVLPNAPGLTRERVGEYMLGLRDDARGLGGPA